MAALIATVFAAWAAWETHNSAVETAKATRATVWIQMLNDYAAPEMLAAMKDLRAWRTSDPKNFHATFKELLLKRVKTRSETELEDRLDSSRRRVSQFFNKLRVLCLIHVLDESDVGLTWSTGTYTFVTDVLVPMENAKTEALLAEGSITQNDKLRADKIQQATLNFYHRVFREHLPK